MKPYTVLLLYPGYMAENYGEETYLAHVKAKTVKAAVKAAQKEADCTGAPEDMFPLMVLAGHHDDLLED